MNTWSDQKKWWMDLLRSMITFTIIAISSFFLIESYNNQRNDSRERSKVKLQYLEDIAEEFETASLTFFDSAYYAYIQKLGSKNDKSITEALLPANQIQKFLGNDKERFTLVIARIELYFPQLKPDTDNLKAVLVSLIFNYGFEDKAFYENIDKGKALTKELIIKIREEVDVSWNSLIENGTIPNNRAIDAHD